MELACFFSEEHFLPFYQFHYYEILWPRWLSALILSALNNSVTSKICLLHYYPFFQSIYICYLAYFYQHWCLERSIDRFIPFWKLTILLSLLYYLLIWKLSLLLHINFFKNEDEGDHYRIWKMCMCCINVWLLAAYWCLLELQGVCEALLHKNNINPWIGPPVL